MTYVKNKIARGEIIILQFTRLRHFFEIFPTKPEVTSSIEKNIVRFVFSMSELVENDTSLAYIGQF